MIAAALRLARHGLHVFPCLPRDKRPATQNGLKAATADSGVIARWWRENPNYNIAIATGAVSRLFVVDVDGLDAEAELRKLEEKHGTLPATIESITARGRHLFFKWPDKPVRNSASKIAPGVDTRGDGGYVLAPPSVHPSGRRYTWSVDGSSTLAPAPDWLLGTIAESARANGGGIKPPTEFRELVQGVAEGARDCSAAKLAGYLLRRHVDPFVALDMLQLWNAARCMPPLPEMDIERIVGSICSKELKRRQADGR